MNGLTVCPPKKSEQSEKYTKNSGDPKDDKFYARLNSMLRGDIPEDDTLKYYSDVISGAIAKFELKHDIIFTDLSITILWKE